jgi:hypothetical protein
MSVFVCSDLTAFSVVVFFYILNSFVVNLCEESVFFFDNEKVRKKEQKEKIFIE